LLRLWINQISGGPFHLIVRTSDGIFRANHRVIEHALSIDANMYWSIPIRNLRNRILRFHRSKNRPIRFQDAFFSLLYAQVMGTFGPIIGLSRVLYPYMGICRGPYPSQHCETEPEHLSLRTKGYTAIVGVQEPKVPRYCNSSAPKDTGYSRC